MGSSFIFRSLSHFEFTFVYGVRELYQFSNYKLPQMYWLKTTQIYHLIVLEFRGARWVSLGLKPRY